MSHGHGPPPAQQIRERGRRVVDGRDITPAVGRRGEPGRWRRAVEGARVLGFNPRFDDGRWSVLYKADARYAAAAKAHGEVPAAARRMRGEPEVLVPVRGPVIRPNV